MSFPVHFESLFSINSDQNLITPSSLFLALLVARAFNAVFAGRSGYSASR